MIRFPSGSKKHPDRNHDHVVVRANATSVIAVPICTMRPDVTDHTCPIEPHPDIADVVQKPSYARYAGAREHTRASIAERETSGKLKVKKNGSATWAEVVAEIDAGLPVSKQTPDGVRRRLDDF